MTRCIIEVHALAGDGAPDPEEIVCVYAAQEFNLIDACKSLAFHLERTNTEKFRPEYHIRFRVNTTIDDWGKTLARVLGCSYVEKDVA